MRTSRHGLMRPSLTTLALTTLALAAVVVSGIAMPAAAAIDEGPPPEPEGGISQNDILNSVHSFSLDAVHSFDVAGHVRPLGDVDSSGGQTTISLSSDLLFAENSWELPGSAPGRISALVEDIPEGATVQVTGHTDSQQPIGQDFDNQELSENRAEAVADVLAGERPDLTLEVSGVGESEPAVTPNPDDPQTHAANRRVEIVYPG